MARAVYRQASINVLDDVLAAVDVHVGKLLFEECICGAMAASTRILVTNQMHIMQKCDKVYLMDDGRIVERGRPAALLADPASRLSKMVAASGHEEEEEKEEGEEKKKEAVAEGSQSVRSIEELEAVADEKTAGAAAEGKTAAEDGTLGSAEDRKKGAVMVSVYGRYLRFGASCSNLLALLALLVGTELLNILGQLWVGLWAEAAGVCAGLTDGRLCQELMTHTTSYWTAIYAGITLSSVVVVFIRNYTWAGNDGPNHLGL